jgi:hypothetical protein
LWLDTDALDPVRKAAIEILCDPDTRSRERDVLRFRQLFREMS